MTKCLPMSCCLCGAGPCQACECFCTHTHCQYTYNIYIYIYECIMSVCIHVACICIEHICMYTCINTPFYIYIVCIYIYIIYSITQSYTRISMYKKYIHTYMHTCIYIYIHILDNYAVLQYRIDSAARSLTHMCHWNV